MSSAFVDLDDDSSFNSPESKAVAGDIIEKIMKDEPNINISAEKLKPAAKQPESRAEKPKIKEHHRYVAPTLDLLFDVKSDNTELQESVQKKAQVLEAALETFNINAKVTRMLLAHR